MTETTVLVTGATGFIAGHCIEELLSHGYAVRGTVRNAATAGVAHLRAIARRTGGSLEFAQASLDDDAGWAEAVRGCTYVWHLASPVPAKLPKDEVTEERLRQARELASQLRRVANQALAQAEKAEQVAQDFERILEARQQAQSPAKPTSKAKSKIA